MTSQTVRAHRQTAAAWLAAEQPALIVEVVAINDLFDAESNFHLLEYDSVYGRANLDAKVQGGALEGTNVNMTQALVDMIENQRSYEVQANLLKEAKSMDESSASLMRMPG